MSQIEVLAVDNFVELDLNSPSKSENEVMMNSSSYKTTTKTTQQQQQQKQQQYNDVSDLESQEITRETTSIKTPTKTELQLQQFAAKATTCWFTLTRYHSDYTRSQLFKDILECLEILQKFLDYWSLSSFFAPMLIYVDRYIHQVGEIGSNSYL